MPTLRSKRPAPPSSTSRRVRPKSEHRTLTSLPYHVLLDILLYTLPPPPHPPPPPAHLLSIGLLSRALLAPAISALYRTPSLDLPARAFRLLSTLQAHPELGVKIKSLLIPSDPLLARKTPVLGYFPFADFIKLCPGVTEIWISHPADNPPWRLQYVHATKWQYPRDLFNSLTTQRLKVWRWNGLFADMEDAWDTMVRVHLLPSFQTLRRLSAIYFNHAPSEDAVVSTLALLPNLRELELESSYLVNPDFLACLSTSPLRLTSLELINCSVATGEAISAFLVSPVCGSLKILAVRHCRSANLSFLSTLPASLEHLAYDGLYYSSSNSYSNNTPGYETLLPDDTPISWSPVLHSIELLNLRRWSIEACTRLLQSLWTAKVPDVRRLSVHCILDDVGWRERAVLRDTWVERLQDAYIRRAPSQSSRAREPQQQHTGTCGPGNVDIKIDNARPTEMQFSEGHFLELDTRRGRPRPRRGGGGGGGGGGGRARRGTRGSRGILGVRRETEEDDEDYED